MSGYDFNAPRLFVDGGLSASANISCGGEQANYLRNVLRLKRGDEILVFNGRDGEWRAKLDTAGKRDAVLNVIEQTRAQQDGPDIDYLFAPLKRARLDYMVQKAAEMGVARLRPVLTHRTVAERVNLERMRANAIEAAEQCGILHVPDVAQPARLEPVIATWDASRSLIFCDEDSNGRDPIGALKRVPPGRLAVLIGPEGGFDAWERALLANKSYVTRISLGPRILRADTAAIAALALVNAILGDWR
jgi:16S rRNA (uracil1498-N3)-methyltransferase